MYTKTRRHLSHTTAAKWSFFFLEKAETPTHLASLKKIIRWTPCIQAFYLQAELNRTAIE